MAPIKRTRPCDQIAGIAFGGLLPKIYLSPQLQKIFVD
jgi:hypothetical protein